MRRIICSTKPLPALGLLLGLTAFTACQAERPVVAPVDPEWSYHDGDPQLSNNDAWEKMIPASTLLRYDETTLAHVEEPTAK